MDENGITNLISPFRYTNVELISIFHTLQWFGNLVTMDWWDDLWLNEGFASFMEYLGSDEASPSWDLVGIEVYIIHIHVS